MKYFLLGYMASGKTTIGRELSIISEIKFIDLDVYIEESYKKTITEIFKTEGEIKFRKLERFYLEELLEKDGDLIVSLGGGTPCYYDSIELINQTPNCVSMYLRVSLIDLVNRLIKEKEYRPLIKDLKNEEVREFIGKHLFERSYYYNKAHVVIENSSIEKSIEKIKAYLI